MFCLLRVLGKDRTLIVAGLRPYVAHADEFLLVQCFCLNLSLYLD